MSDTENDTAKSPKRAHLNMTGAAPLVLSNAEDDSIQMTEGERSKMSVAGKAFSAYSKAAKELLDGRYSHLRQFVPAYLSEPGTVLVTSCEGGVVVRYERDGGNGPKRYGAWSGDSLQTVVKMLSQGLLICRKQGEPQAALQPDGAALELSVGPHQLSKVRYGFDAVIEPPKLAPQPLAKPFCLVSIRNQINVELFGEIEAPNGVKTPFISIAPLRIPTGWDCIEVYPCDDWSVWKPELAPLWAENDILAAVVAHHTRESALHELDPNAAARRRFAATLTEFRALLDSNPEHEEELQGFLNAHPELLCPAYTRVWPKLPLGAHKTDFVFRDATGDYLLVEIERSILRIFKGDSHPTADFNHAHGQIRDWKRYLEDNLPTVQRELGLTAISANPRALIVMGRSKGLNSDLRRRLTTIENEVPKLKVMTYDDVVETATAVVENLLGPLWNPSGTTVLYPQR